MQSIVESAPKKRGNPYRDANGKFCSRAEATYIVIDGELRHLPGKHDQSTHGKGGSVSWQKKKVGTSSVWQSGDHKITNFANSGMSDSEVEEVIVPRVSNLMQTNPVDGPVDLRFVKRLVSPSGKSVNGINELGTGRIKISGGVADYKASDFQNAKGSKPGMAPAQFKDKKLMKSESTLVHEWGHAIDRRSPKNKGKTSVDTNSVAAIKSVSQYGDSSPFEAYAENFSEFYLSKGKTTEKAALDSAKEFGWKI